MKAIVSAWLPALVGTMAFSLTASAIAQCKPVTVSIVNRSGQAVTVIGADVAAGSQYQHDILVAAHEYAKATICKMPYYNRDNRIELAVANEPAKFSLVNPGAAQVSIRINANGSIDQSGLHQAGFDMDDYIQWHGINSVL